MAPDHDLTALTRRLGQRFRDGVPRAEDRGTVEDADVLWPVDAEFSLAGATGWLNSSPLTGADLRGRVVLVNFWTFTCINWLRAMPYVRAWQETYGSHGLVVVGVHSPEFSFEHDVESVRRAARDRSIGYPIAIDNDFAVWRSFHNHYWPASYLVDADGRLQHHTFGEGGYEETDEVIRRLLVEAGAGDLPPSPEPEARGVEVAADWDTLRSPETYLGYDRTSGFAGSGGLVVTGRPHVWSPPDRMRVGHWALSGSWTVAREASIAQEAGGRVVCRFEARDVHLVMAPPPRGATGRFQVLLDGRAPGPDHGVDVDAEGRGTITEPRLHHLVRRTGTVVPSTVQVEFLDAGVGVYAFTFG